MYHLHKPHTSQGPWIRSIVWCKIKICNHFLYFPVTAISHRKAISRNNRRTVSKVAHAIGHQTKLSHHIKIETWFLPYGSQLPRLTTDRGFMPLNGSKLGHNFSVMNSWKVAASTVPLWRPTSNNSSVQMTGIAVTRAPRFCMTFFTTALSPTRLRP